MTRSHIKIALALDTLQFVEDGPARRGGELGMDGRSTLFTRRPRDGRILFVLYVVRRSSLWPVFGFSVLGFFP